MDCDSFSSTRILSYNDDAFANACPDGHSNPYAFPDRDGDTLRAEAATACRERIAAFYTWDNAAADQERFFRFLVGEAPDFSESF